MGHDSIISPITDIDTRANVFSTDVDTRVNVFSPYESTVTTVTSLVAHTLGVPRTTGPLSDDRPKKGDP